MMVSTDDIAHASSPLMIDRQAERADRMNQHRQRHFYERPDKLPMQHPLTKPVIEAAS
jgi:hypothetical protein